MNWDIVISGAIALLGATLGFLAQPITDERRYKRTRHDEIKDRQFMFQLGALTNLEFAASELGVLAADHITRLYLSRPDDEIPHGAVFAAHAKMVGNLNKVSNDELRKAAQGYNQEIGKVLGAHRFDEALEALKPSSAAMSHLQRMIGGEMRRIHDELSLPIRSPKEQSQSHS